ncbi:sensor domain-containing protein [Aquisalibacillus elongatus]|uniref:PAS domain S-box-containing protein/diguanylate cyclase (GGDEF)-like protein n=1 Tax=Aquisalibacillus elongatus TaxID=485577 RepID=A0A3N5B4E0_9BACI|nr:EAL domain-containing protein [Aquisalibacillus elongatus]RPF52274.1 PAS domain S-box-containing protein/diguanylate cyclase (GGDEF)-like protein [Aquisalibacillus elongatus]
MRHKANKCGSIPIHNWIFDNIMDAVLFMDQNGMILDFNQASKELLHLDIDQKPEITNYLCLDSLTPTEGKEQLVKTNENPERLILAKSIFIDDQICLVIREGGLKANKDTLHYSFNNLMNGPYEGVVMHDGEKIVDCDQAFASLSGYNRSELLGQSILDLIHPNDHQKMIKSIQSTHNAPYTVKGIRKDDSVIYTEIVPETLQIEENSMRIAVVRNITERIENEKQIEFMAYYDELTDLPNRNYFQKVLKDEIKAAELSSRQLAVHFIDLDYFKHINDTLGYQFGDQLLKSCADRLKKLLLEDVFIARMTGDEFLVLQRNIGSEEDAKAFAQKLIKYFKQPLNVDGYEIYTSISVGISLYPDLAQTPSDLIKQADTAMNLTKERNKNDYQVFKKSLTEGFKERLHLETELHKALKNKDFELYFQPQIDIKQDEIIGLEALCRWNHIDKGIIPPNQFIPLAEQTGLIVELGDWVIREACRQNKMWQDMGFPKVKVSVNLSAKQFLQRDLVSNIAEILANTGLESEYLELEITESMAMTNEKYIIETLKGFQTLGVNVALDDFGTGYSSLKYLSQFPLSKLKIDRLFIQNRTEQNIAIVKTIIHLSHSLNLKVIAEGVENEEDLMFLNNENCDEVQGFYFSKPLPVSEVNGFFNKKLS